MPHQRINAIHVALRSCNVCRRRATLRAITSSPYTQSPLLSLLRTTMKSLRAHLHRLVHIRAMSHQRIDALHVAFMSCNVRRRRAILLAITSTAHTHTVAGEPRLHISPL